MTCSYDRVGGCSSGYDYYYDHCCSAGMTTFWYIFMWISIALCVCLCCSMMLAAMRRRRMQMMMAQQRNMHGGQQHRMRHNSDTSSEDSSMLHHPPSNAPPRPVYNAPIGGSTQTTVMYAPPAMAMAPLSVGVRPAVDPTKGTTQVRITLATGQTTTLDLNLHHTVADIHTYVMSVAPTSGSYQLYSGYPPKPLADPSMTIEKAKLQQANVHMRLI